MSVDRYVRWEWIGRCSCLGQDGDCAADDRNWRQIPGDPRGAVPDAEGDESDDCG